MGTILRAAATYIFLLFVLRVIGRRSVSQMTPFDLIVIFLLGGLMIQAVITDDRSIVNAFLAVITIGVMHVTISYMKRRFPRVGELVDGTPVVLYNDGRWHHERLSNMRLQEQDVMSAVRERGLESLKQVKYAVVERNGSISIIER